MTETTAIAARPTTAAPRWRMVPGSLGEAMEMAALIAGSELCPKAYRGKPQDCIVAYEYGAALGLSWMQSLRSVSTINGQAALWGDAIPALIYGSGECERFHEYFEGEKGTDSWTAVCIMKRKGFPDEVKRTFSVADAKAAKLWGKRGRDGQDTPWVTYPDRMLQMRPRGFAARDTFADKLSGLILAEEAMDYPSIDGTVVASEVVDEKPMALVRFEALPEGVRDSIEKGFATLNFAPGQRLTKLNEYLGGDVEPVNADEQAVLLLDWLKDEYAKRRTGQPRAKKGNAKEARKESGSPDPGTTPTHQADAELVTGIPARSGVGVNQGDVRGRDAEKTQVADKHASAAATSVTPVQAPPVQDSSELF